MNYKIFFDLHSKFIYLHNLTFGKKIQKSIIFDNFLLFITITCFEFVLLIMQNILWLFLFFTQILIEI